MTSTQCTTSSSDAGFISGCVNMYIMTSAWRLADSHEVFITSNCGCVDHDFYTAVHQKPDHQWLCEYVDLFSLYFLQLYCPIRISSMGNLGCFPWGKLVATESSYLTYGAYWAFEFCHNPLSSDMDYRIFNVRIDVNYAIAHGVGQTL